MDGFGHLDGPALLTPDQFEVLAQVGAVAKETHFDDLPLQDVVPAGRHRGGLVGWIRLAGGRRAPPGQGSAVPRHHTEQDTTERRPRPSSSTQRATSELKVPEWDTTVTRRRLIK